MLACAVAAAAVVVAVVHSSGGSSAGERDDPPEARREAQPPAPSAADRRLAAALKAGVEEAAALGGEVEAAAMLDGSPAPIVVTSEEGGAQRHMRLWSLSKVVTMVALLRSLGWEERAGEMPSPEVASALEGALTRSENCRQRRVVLELQEATGGVAGARRALAEVLSLAGGRIVPGAQVEEPESLCVPFLSEQAEIPDPMSPALLLGTSRWRVADAVRLVHALSAGTYGASVSSRVLDLMRARKEPSRESESGELTAPIDWGAGAVFLGLLPAYKAGWGGALNGNFMAGQIALVPAGGGGELALAVMFHPDAQPSRDDPGITAAPEAIESVMEAVRSSTFPSDSPAHR